MYAAGIEIVRGILDNWNCTFERGVAPANYIGDIFGSLGGHPDFGFGSITGGRRLRAAKTTTTTTGAAKVNRTAAGTASLAGVEMARRRRFGVKGAKTM